MKAFCADCRDKRLVASDRCNEAVIESMFIGDCDSWRAHPLKVSQARRLRDWLTRWLEKQESPLDRCERLA